LNPYIFNSKMCMLIDDMDNGFQHYYSWRVDIISFVGQEDEGDIAYHCLISSYIVTNLYVEDKNSPYLDTIDIYRFKSIILSHGVAYIPKLFLYTREEIGWIWNEGGKIGYILYVQTLIIMFSPMCPIIQSYFILKYMHKEIYKK
jgi:hypothetical protein